ncbi:related to Protein SDS23 [Saccharomycodes ludwigii]|uniref:Related to Protein SDS23 n=1 Tax=Saccharomycodes ludwigii TaxID=36035 RepID=A0A376B4A7_9ASCO|nr:hypothetical protein SCDLUD_000977 [Saccharomycodes ludwigii]KAH3903349.1 hypothetical protein SCDLUD_000977 [Saccharomycodes ludwigii]SSD59525.1 related to Protein SDS23 [Saccharomycodes ludwigii]
MGGSQVINNSNISNGTHSSSTSINSSNTSTNSAKRHDSIVEMLSSPLMNPISNNTCTSIPSLLENTTGNSMSSGTNNSITATPGMFNSFTASELSRTTSISSTANTYNNVNSSVSSSPSTSSLTSLGSSTIGVTNGVTANASNNSNSNFNFNSNTNPNPTDDMDIHSTTMHHSNSWFVFKVHKKNWEHIKLSQLIESNKLIYIRGDLSVEDAFNKLVEYNLTSLPVLLDETTEDGSSVSTNNTEAGNKGSGANSIGIKSMNCLTFDYNDLNSYLLLVLGKIKVLGNNSGGNNNISAQDLEKITRDCQMGKPVPVGEIVRLTPKNPFYKIPQDESLSTAMGILGSGVHKIAITDIEQQTILGILSQRRLIKYIWDNARNFKNLEPLLNASLQSLKIGVLNYSHKTASTSSGKPSSSNIPGGNNASSSSGSFRNTGGRKYSRVISISGDEPLINALYKMHIERISSIAVVDSQGILLGNISVTDVKNVTRTSQYPLLHNTCRHFITVILNNRGLEMGGKDSFPIFHVYPSSSLARTLAKLVATKAHRLWIVQPSDVGNGNANNNNSANTSNNNSATGHHHHHHHHHHNSTTNNNSSTNSSFDIPRSVSPMSVLTDSISTTSINNSTTTLNSNADDNNNSSSHISSSSANSNNNSSNEYNNIYYNNSFDNERGTGKLIGVVSLTDILGLFARRQTEYKEIDPQMARRQRSSVGI